ncbi:MAG: hypothetical protein A2Y12_09345 [Planctomycetes bacterium GWF2_42_9]|nr:MAG: hypothetical protein A2Y12_09345 [Planctomycetes bacterium GWF2_42_9]
MKLFLFFDDYLIDSKQDVVRVFPAATLEHTFPHYSSKSGITHYNVATKKYEAWDSFENGGILAVSDDGINWNSKRQPGKLRLIGDMPKGCSLRRERLPYDEEGLKGDRWHGLEFYDKSDKDASRRCKCTIWPFTSNITKEGAIEGGPSLIACSPDGIDWTVDMRHQWFRGTMGSDTSNNIFYNPITKMWQVVCRCYNLDRRIAIVESPDLINWTEPRVIVHPEETDGPCTQFYGMPPFAYEDEYLIGAVAYVQTSLGEKIADLGGFTSMSWSKWLGRVEVKLAYSYDGRGWWRPDRRHTLLARTEPGTYGCGSIYCKSIEMGDDGKINFYSKGYLANHGIDNFQYPDDGKRLMKHTLRHDGFCYLETRGWGYFSTRPLVLKEDELTINYNAGNVGSVKVQVSDFQGKPMSGYTFDDCIPLTGDEVYGKVMWKKHKNLADLPVKERVRIEFKFIDARIYALRVNCGLWFTNTPKPIDRI